ncbi:hypothetical protein ACCO45_001544 [Purpureocillium lilacinum]|uniref:Uncharacterized protein n=1 Tax=Purpureocillium lilacinum TaxID=33203 RepID=A0ACC4E7B7_PURLI
MRGRLESNRPEPPQGVFESGLGDLSPSRSRCCAPSPGPETCSRAASSAAPEVVPCIDLQTRAPIMALQAVPPQRAQDSSAAPRPQARDGSADGAADATADVDTRDATVIATAAAVAADDDRRAAQSLTSSKPTPQDAPLAPPTEPLIRTTAHG